MKEKINVIVKKIHNFVGVIMDNKGFGVKSVDRENKETKVYNY
jgi:hypothetical protein